MKFLIHNTNSILVVLQFSSYLAVCLTMMQIQFWLCLTVLKLPGCLFDHYANSILVMSYGSQVT